jgi:hypothetical protein
LEEALEIYWNKKRAIHTLKYASKQYSIFEFLLGLGQHFVKTSDFHRHTINDVYDILLDFVTIKYPEDPVLKALVSIDYYARPYLKPQVRYTEEVERSVKNQIVEQRKFNHHLYRHIIIQTPLSIASVEDQSYNMEPCYTVFEYNAKTSPVIQSFIRNEHDRTIIRSSTLQQNDLES